MRTLYPYQTLVGAVVISRVDAWISTEDGEKKLPSNYVDPERMDILLAEIAGDDWEEARLRVVVDVPAEEIGGNPDWTGGRVALIGECGYTNTRQIAAMEREDARGSRWSGELIWARSMCYGRGRLRAVVLATVDGIRDRPLGRSEAWTMDFDKLPENPVHGSIPVVWVNFQEPPDGSRHFKRYAKDPWMVALDPLTPTLYLNSAFPELTQLLDDSARLRRVDTALRDTLRAELAAQVWQAMFLYALASAQLDEETGEVQPPPEEWQRSVLSALLARMYPGRPDGDALREAREGLCSAESLGALLQLLMPASTEQAQGPRLIGDSLRRLALDTIQPPREA